MKLSSSIILDWKLIGFFTCRRWCRPSLIRHTIIFMIEHDTKWWKRLEMLCMRPRPSNNNTMPLFVLFFFSTNTKEKGTTNFICVVKRSNGFIYDHLTHICRQYRNFKFELNWFSCQRSLSSAIVIHRLVAVDYVVYLVSACIKIFVKYKLNS